MTKSFDELPADEADKRRDEALKRALKMPPKQHEPIKLKRKKSSQSKRLG